MALARTLCFDERLFLLLLLLVVRRKLVMANDDECCDGEEDLRTGPHSAILQQWSAEQVQISSRAVYEDAAAGFAMPWQSASDASLPPLSLVGGVDVSFLKGTDIAVASLVVLKYPSLEVVHVSMHHCTMDLPYIPGFLAFREVRPLQFLIDGLRQAHPELVPQLILVDGNGKLHYRRCGQATHLGIVCDIPTIGCAKKLLAVDGLMRDVVKPTLIKQYEDSGGKLNSLPLQSPLTGELLGVAALTGNSSRQPIYVSPGHRVSVQSAWRLVESMGKTRIPEPVRQADLRSRAYIRQHFPPPAAGTDKEK